MRGNRHQFTERIELLELRMLTWNTGALELGCAARGVAGMVSSVECQTFELAVSGPLDPASHRAETHYSLYDLWDSGPFEGKNRESAHTWPFHADASHGGLGGARGLLYRRLGRTRSASSRTSPAAMT
jgi:hypothetical protein